MPGNLIYLAQIFLISKRKPRLYLRSEFWKLILLLLVYINSYLAMWVFLFEFIFYLYWEIPV